MNRIGDMEVVTPLNEGGMGRVVLAKRTGAHGFEKLVAVKVIRGDLVRFEEVRKMFLDEARVLSNLTHPAIAQVYDFGEDGTRLYLAMEYVAGIPLHHFLKLRKEALPPVIAARIVAEVCRGLHAAHELKDLEGTPLGVVHRDISPHNLMLTFDGKVKIIDFGIALVRDRESAETKTGLLKGKISYVAPEQIDGADVDRRADVYSAAVVLHELLTGKALFGGGPDAALATALARRDVKKPSSIQDGVPKELDEITLRGLRVEPEDRFEDARAMAKALDKFLAVAGGESLEDFSERELAREEEQHRDWLRKVLAGGFEIEARTEVTEDKKAPAPKSKTSVPAIVPPPEVRSPPARYGLGAGVIAFAVFASVIVVAALVAGEDLMGSTEPPPTVASAAPEPEPEPEMEAEPEPEPEPEPELAPVAAPTPPPSSPAKVTRAAKPVRVKRKRKKEKWGLLSIGARRGGWIYVGGKPFGRTPLRRARIATGKHVVALRRPGDRRPRWVSKITIREGKHVEIRLR